MEVNREEAIRCLSIAQRHRSSSNLPSALKFAKKSVSLYSTPEGEALVTIIQREIIVSATTADSESSAGPSTPTPNGSASTPNGAARASGVEEHASAAGVHRRPGHEAAGASGPSRAGAAATGEKPKEKREYTAKQMEVVKRVKMCKHHQYYEILSLEKTCTENDVKKAYKKLALALHPDKNGAPGADEAFKMVSKAFQVLSDTNLRQIFDSNPTADPTQRGGGGGASAAAANMFRGGGMHFPQGGGGFQGEINPEDLFNMFFGGGGMGGGPFGGQANVFTFGGPGGFRTFQTRRPGQQAQNAEPSSPFVALLPLLILFLFALVSVLPSIFSNVHPDPTYAFTPSTQYDQHRTTWNWNVDYYVNKDEWEGSRIWQSVPESRRANKDAAMYSSKVRSFERGVENVYVNSLRNECEVFSHRQQQRIANEAGFFGFGADHDKIREIRREKSPACEQLRKWGVQMAW